MKINKSIATLDETLLILFGASLIVPSIAEAYGVDTKILWVPIIFYASWTFIVAYYKPNRFFSDYPERAIIERIRGWQYVFSLATTLLLNGLFFTILPKTLITIILGGLFVAFLLMLVVRFLPRGLFRKEVTFMSKHQEVQMLFVLKESGIASIRFSVSILTLNLDLLSSTESSILNTFLTSIIVIGFFVYGYKKEKDSSKLASDFAINLKNSNWFKKYSFHQRRNKKKSGENK